jgi:hypothetical protein
VRAPREEDIMDAMNRTDVAELERRLQRLEDVEAIRRLE